MEKQFSKRNVALIFLVFLATVFVGTSFFLLPTVQIEQTYMQSYFGNNFLIWILFDYGYDFTFDALVKSFLTFCLIGNLLLLAIITIVTVIFIVVKFNQNSLALRILSIVIASVCVLIIIIFLLLKLTLFIAFMFAMFNRHDGGFALMSLRHVVNGMFKYNLQIALLSGIIGCSLNSAFLKAKLE